MILPIYTYGQPVLRKQTEEITADYPNLKQLIADMYETMDKADGVGLAAPQIGLPIRLFVIDGDVLGDDYPDCKGFRKTFINPQIISSSEETVSYEEGCLSLPGISETVVRPATITIRYMDEDFQEQTETYGSYSARIVQHEYDHLEGHVFTDRVSPIRRQFLKTKLANIAKGKTACRYRTKK